MKVRTLGPRLIRATVFKAASVERWKDADCLHRARRFEGAIYLCGYALECMLKFCICEGRGHIEERKAKQLGHGLWTLLCAAGLSEKLARNSDLLVAFHAINNRWSTEIRYSGAGGNIRESERFLNDTRALCLWLRTESRS